MAAVALHHAPPKASRARTLLWRARIWVEATFALSMLEPWEKLLVVSVFLIVTVLLSAGVYRYMPHHLNFIARRARYYLLGDETMGSGWKAVTHSTEL